MIPKQLSYLPQHRVLICLLCQVGIRPGKAATTHLRNTHQWKSKQLANAVAYISTLPLQDPHIVPLPPNKSAAIPELGKPVSGYHCGHCGYLRRHKEDIQAHLRKERHEGVNGQGWQPVLLQTFSRGRHARYWIVSLTGGEEDGGHVRDEIDDSFRSTLEQYRIKYDAKRTKRREIADNPGEVENQSTWVREIGWAEHFEKKNKRDIHLASLMPRAAGTRVSAHRRNDETLGEVDMLLMRLGKSFDRIIQRCSARLKLVPHETLRWLNSIDPTKPAGRPFTLKENEKSMYRYRQFMKRNLVYSSRTARLGREEARQQRQMRWTDEQWTLQQQINEELTRLGPARNDTPDDEAAREEAALDQVVFRALISVLQQQLAFNVFINPLLHFAAVLGINDALGSWAEPKHYTASLAGLVWCSRMVILENVFQDSPDDPNEVSVDMVEQFKHEQQRWLADGGHSPFSTMTRWMGYGKGFRTKEGGTAKVLWEEGGEALRYLGQRIKIVDFVNAANAAVVDAEQLLDKLVFGSWQEVAASIDLPRIVDSLIFGGPDSSFATDPRNQWLRPGFTFLAERAQGSMWRKDGGWKHKKIPGHLRILQKFKRLLMVLIHIWAGQPGRGPEMTKLKHCGTQQVPANVFVFDGQVMFITDRDKSRSIRGLGRKVARFVPERIGKMVVAYVAWLIPFEEMLCDEVGITGLDETLSSYMWKDTRKGALETEHLSEALASLTGQHMGIELMVSDYRHVAIGLARKIKGIIVRRAEIEMGEGAGDADDGEAHEGSKMEYIWDAQATHGSVIAAAHYAVDMRFPNQMQPEKVAHFREISRLWHRFLEQGGSRSSAVHDQKRSRKRKRVIKPLEKETSEIKTVTSKRVKLSIEVTTRNIQDGLKQLLGPQAQWKIPEQGEAVEAIMKLTPQQALIAVLPTGAGKSILFMLPALLEDIGTSIVVVPFAALMDDLVDRARQAGIDCIRWKPARLQEREQPVRAARLVVVSADVEEIEQFRNYVDGLRERKLLKRIFFDEAHTAILDVAFRHRLEGLKGLHRYGCPVIALTATMPGVMERWFRQTMLMEHAEIIRASTVKHNIQYRVIRIEGDEQGWNQGRRGQGRDKGAVQDEVVRVVLRMEKTMHGDQKGVVYCRSRSACEALAEKLGCDFYHSGIVESERQIRLKAWIGGAGGNRWITATSGLGTGVDIKGIVGVVHMEQPYGMVDFIQQTGRGGRHNSEVVESVIVMEAKKVKIDEKRSDMEQFNHRAMEWFVESEGCRRTVLGMFMDVGLEDCGLDCEQLQVEMCDRCQAKSERVDDHAGLERGGDEEIIEEEKDSDKEDEEGEEDEDDEEDETSSEAASSCDPFSQYIKAKHVRIAELRDWLDMVGDRCPICVAMWRGRRDSVGGRRYFGHEIEQCKRVNQEKYRRWRSSVDFGAYGCCWRCGLPQSFCEGAAQRQRCEWGDKMMPLVWWVTQYEGWQSTVGEELGFEGKIRSVDDEKAYGRWVGRSRRLYDEDMTNAIAVWDLMVRETELARRR